MFNSKKFNDNEAFCVWLEKKGDHTFDYKSNTDCCMAQWAKECLSDEEVFSSVGAWSFNYFDLTPQSPVSVRVSMNTTQMAAIHPLLSPNTDISKLRFADVLKNMRASM